jgi:deoxyadenosine/deoxycytidine kinase
MKKNHDERSIGGLMKEKKFIIIAGNIGVGKTTLSQLIASIFKLQVFEERVENNPYLPLFYDDMKKYSFRLQRFFLFTRILDHEIVSNTNHSSLQDRSVYEDAEIFARNLFEQGQMSHEDYKRYRRIYDDVIKDLKRPDLLIYLHATPETLRKRIMSRGRTYEQSLTQKDNPYLEQLQKLYDEWSGKYEGKKLVIDTNQLDLVHKPEDLNKIVAHIQSAIGERDDELTQYV